MHTIIQYPADWEHIAVEVCSNLSTILRVSYSQHGWNEEYNCGMTDNCSSILVNNHPRAYVALNSHAAYSVEAFSTVYLQVHFSYLSLSLSISLSLSLHLYVSLSVSLFVSLPLSLSVSLSPSLCFSLSVSLFLSLYANCLFILHTTPPTLFLMHKTSVYSAHTHTHTHTHPGQGTRTSQSGCCLSCGPNLSRYHQTSHSHTAKCNSITDHQYHPINGSCEC